MSRTTLSGGWSPVSAAPRNGTPVILWMAAYDGPIDVNNPRLPERWLNRWVEEELALKDQGLSALDLTPEELRARWPKRLAAWFEKQVRRKAQARLGDGADGGT